MSVSEKKEYPYPDGIITIGDIDNYVSTNHDPKELSRYIKDIFNTTKTVVKCWPDKTICGYLPVWGHFKSGPTIGGTWTKMRRLHKEYDKKSGGITFTGLAGELETDLGGIVLCGGWSKANAYEMFEKNITECGATSFIVPTSYYGNKLYDVTHWKMPIEPLIGFYSYNEVKNSWKELLIKEGFPDPSPLYSSDNDIVKATAIFNKWRGN